MPAIGEENKMRRRKETHNKRRWQQREKQMFCLREFGGSTFKLKT